MTLLLVKHNSHAACFKLRRLGLGKTFGGRLPSNGTHDSEAIRHQAMTRAFNIEFGLRKNLA
jgi:hypothetical protein